MIRGIHQREPPLRRRGHAIRHVLQIAGVERRPQVITGTIEVARAGKKPKLHRHRDVVGIGPGMHTAGAEVHAGRRILALVAGGIGPPHRPCRIRQRHRVQRGLHRSARVSRWDNPMMVHILAVDRVADEHKPVPSLQQRRHRPELLGRPPRIPHRHPGRRIRAAHDPVQRVVGQNHLHHLALRHAIHHLALERHRHPLAVAVQPMAVRAHQVAAAQVHHHPVQVVADVLHARRHQHPVQRVQLQVKGHPLHIVARSAGHQVQHAVVIELLVERRHQTLPVRQPVRRHDQMPALGQVHRQRLHRHHHRRGQVLRARHPGKPVHRPGSDRALAIEHHRTQHRHRMRRAGQLQNVLEINFPHRLLQPLQTPRRGTRDNPRHCPARRAAAGDVKPSR